MHLTGKQHYGKYSQQAPWHRWTSENAATHTEGKLQGVKVYCDCDQCLMGQVTVRIFCAWGIALGREVKEQWCAVCENMQYLFGLVTPAELTITKRGDWGSLG